MIFPLILKSWLKYLNDPKYWNRLKCLRKKCAPRSASSLRAVWSGFVLFNKTFCYYLLIYCLIPYSMLFPWEFNFCIFLQFYKNTCRSFHLYSYHYTVKPAYVVTSIKGSLNLSSHMFWFPWSQIQCKWTCIKGSPVLSSQFSGFPWVTP